MILVIICAGTSGVRLLHSHFFPNQNIRPTIVNFRKWQAVQGAMPWVASDVALQAFSEAHDPESPLHISGKVRYS